MKQLSIITFALCTAGAVASPAFAADSMSEMPMKQSPSQSASATALSDAQVINVDSAAGMVTLKHGELANIGMPAMTMAYKAKDAAMAQRVHEGEKVKVRIESVDGTPTIVTMVKAPS